VDDDVSAASSGRASAEAVRGHSQDRRDFEDLDASGGRPDVFGRRPGRAGRSGRGRTTLGVRE